MADTKLSALTAASVPTSLDEFYVNDGGTSKRITWGNILKQIGQQRSMVTPFDYGAVGDNTADDTTACQTAINTGACWFPPYFTFKTTATLTVPTFGTAMGAGYNSVINAVGVSGAVIQLGDGGSNVWSDWTVMGLKLHGTATYGIKLDYAPAGSIWNLYIDVDCTDCFWAQNSFSSSFNYIRTHGSAVTNACYKVQGFMSNCVFNNCTTSNTGVAYNWYCADDILSLGTSVGCVFNSCTAQGGTRGVYLGHLWSGSVWNGLYTELTVHAVTLGDYANNRYTFSHTFNGGILGTGGSFQTGFSTRRALIDFNYCRGVSFNNTDLSGSFNISGTAYVAAATGGGTGFWGIVRVKPDGTANSVMILDGGTGWSGTPTFNVTTVTAGTGMTVTGTQSGGVINTLSIGNVGAGYTAETLFPAIYTNSARCSLNYCHFNDGAGLNTPLWPWIVRSTTAVNGSGINITGDVPFVGDSLTSGNLEMNKNNANDHVHTLSWYNGSGVATTRQYTPPSYP